MFYLVSYDIPSTPRRTKVAKTLLNFGSRVQYSVFECILDDKLLEAMTAKLKKLVQDEDSIRIYQFCAKCERAITILGRGKVTEDEEVYIL